MVGRRRLRLPLLAPVADRGRLREARADQETDWDFAYDCLVTHGPPGVLNLVTGVCGLAAMLWLYGVAWHQPMADSITWRARRSPTRSRRRTVLRTPAPGSRDAIGGPACRRRRRARSRRPRRRRGRRRQSPGEPIGRRCSRRSSTRATLARRASRRSRARGCCARATGGARAELCRDVDRARPRQCRGVALPRRARCRRRATTRKRSHAFRKAQQQYDPLGSHARRGDRPRRSAGSSPTSSTATAR